MESYKRAINLLMMVALDYRAVVIRLAQEHPEIFLEMAAPVAAVPQWHRDVVECLRSDQVVEAIKTIRKETGLGLKESKDVVDNLRNGFYYNSSPLTSEMQWAVYLSVKALM